MLPAVFGIVESAGFVMISFADSHDPLSELTEQLLTIHRIKFLLRDVNVVVTVILGAFALYFRWRNPAGAGNAKDAG